MNCNVLKWHAIRNGNQQFSNNIRVYDFPGPKTFPNFRNPKQWVHISESKRNLWWLLPLSIKKSIQTNKNTFFIRYSHRNNNLKKRYYLISIADVILIDCLIDFKHNLQHYCDVSWQVILYWRRKLQCLERTIYHR